MYTTQRDPLGRNRKPSIQTLGIPSRQQQEMGNVSAMTQGWNNQTLGGEPYGIRYSGTQDNFAPPPPDGANTSAAGFGGLGGLSGTGEIDLGEVARLFGGGRSGGGGGQGMFGGNFQLPEFDVPNFSGAAGGSVQQGDTTVQNANLIPAYQAMLNTYGQLGQTGMQTALGAYQTDAQSNLGQLQALAGLFNTQLQNQGNMGTTGLTTEAQKAIAQTQAEAARYAAEQNNRANIMAQERANGNNSQMMGFAGQVFGNQSQPGVSVPKLNPQAALNSANAASARQEASALAGGGAGGPGAGAAAARAGLNRAMADSQSAYQIPEQYAQTNFNNALAGQNSGATRTNANVGLLNALRLLMG